jgi:hypothetical protein
MAVNKDRELIIRAAWEERGKAQWKPETHGRGLLPLNIPAKIEMRPVRIGSPLPAYDNLEFRLTPITTNGQQANAIVCEGVVVETIQSHPSSIAISANVRCALPRQPLFSCLTICKGDAECCQALQVRT